MTEETLKKLIAAFQRGFRDNEACAYAEITLDELRSYEKDNPDFVKEKAAHLAALAIIAKDTIAKELKTNPSFALRYIQDKQRHKPRSYIGFGYL